jgi:hypothetical protein
MEFFQPQIKYLEEMLDLRYRLKMGDIQRLDEKQLRDVIIKLDES